MSKIIQNKGITLVALVITIVILLILSGITIAQLTGNGLFGKAQLAAKETKYANAAEKVALAVNASYDESGKINDNLLKDNVNEIDGLDKKVDQVTYDLKIVVDGFEFIISEYGKITGEKSEIDIEDYSDMILKYNVSKNSEDNMQYDKLKLYDLSGNGNDALLYNMTLIDNDTGLQFNGSSSYAKMNLKSTITFPCTIEMNIKTTTEQTNSLIYLEPTSKTAFGIYGSHFCLTISTASNSISVPSDFFDGNLKHIVIVYKSLTDFELYINGIKLTKSSSTDALTAGIGSISYLGRRGQGNYFDGKLYNFRIYNRQFDESEINFTTNDENLLLEYDLSKDFKYAYKSLELQDLSGNDNNATCSNIYYTDDKKGIVFNGSSSYAIMNLKSAITFPCTIEMDIKTTTKTTNSLIYLEPTSKTAFGIYGSNFNLTISTASNLISVPSDFYDGNLKHIVIVYKSLTDFELYINGIKLTKSSSTDAWTAGIGSISYLGRRGQGNYFDGELYEFNIYNKILTESEIKEEYIRAKDLY